MVRVKPCPCDIAGLVTCTWAVVPVRTKKKNRRRKKREEKEEGEEKEEVEKEEEEEEETEEEEEETEEEEEEEKGEKEGEGEGEDNLIANPFTRLPKLYYNIETMVYTSFKTSCSQQYMYSQWIFV